MSTERGAAALSISLSNGRITVTHSHGGARLLEGPCPEGGWSAICDAIMNTCPEADGLMRQDGARVNDDLPLERQISEAERQLETAAKLLTARLEEYMDSIVQDPELDPAEITDRLVGLVSTYKGNWSGGPTSVTNYVEHTWREAATHALRMNIRQLARKGARVNEE